MPQLPRHWYAKDAIAWLSYVANEEQINLAAGVSDRDSGATGKELEHDLSSMKIQLHNNTWAIDNLNEALQQPENRPPYPAGKVLSNTPDTH